VAGGHRKTGRLFILLDLIAAQAAFYSAVLLRFGRLHPIPPFFDGSSYLFYSLLILVLYSLILSAWGIGRGRLPALGGLLKAVLTLGVLANVLPFYFQGFAFSRFVFMGFSLLSLFYGLGWRFVYFILIESPGLAHLASERVVLAAVRERLDALERAAGTFAVGRFEVVGRAVDCPADGERKDKSAAVCLEDLPELARRCGADLVLLDPEGLRPARWLSLADKLAAARVPLRLFTGTEPGPPLALEQSPEGGALALLAEPLGPFSASLKRGLDIAVAACVLLLALPLGMLVALVVRLSSPGPVFYVQERVGRNGRPFRLRKFRSMFHGAESVSGPVWSEPGDSRVVPGVGAFIRRTGLDELPQFWNVLSGDMSLVGPRPERAFFFDAYPDLYRGRLAVRPGLTGLAQVSCRESTSVELKVRYDLYYIRNYSLALDLAILWRTSVMLVRQEWEVLRGKNGAGGGK